MAGPQSRHRRPVLPAPAHARPGPAVAGDIHVRPLIYPPGSVIIRQGDDADRFYIITAGRAEVFIQHPGGQEVLVDSLASGQYLGEIGLLRGSKRMATVRAASDGPVEVMALDAAAFRTMVSDSPTTREELERITQERLGAPDPARRSQQNAGG